MSLASFLTLITHTLKEEEIPFMLTGSLAAACYGTPRATQDVDIIIEFGMGASIARGLNAQHGPV